MRKLLRQINVIILSFVLIFAPTYVLANTATDSWSISKRLVQGATTFYDGAREVVLNGKSYAAKGTAAITPTASQVSKMIVRTGAVLAVDLAIKALLGGVDYVMDSANNRVKYQAPGEIGTWMVVGVTYENMTIDQACAAARSAYLRHDGSYCFYGTVDPDTGDEILQATWGYALVSSTTKEEKYLPYDAVAAQIIGDAAGKEDAKAYVSSVADTAIDNDEQRQIVPQSEIVNQLNQSQSISTSNTATGSATPTTSTGTGTGDPTTAQPSSTDIKLDFPVFCGWAPTVCQAAQTAINFPEKVETWIDKIFYKTEGLPQYDTQTDLYIHEQPEMKHVNINWGSVCPAPITVNLGFKGISREITVVNYQYICDYAWIIKASVNMIASISAVYIVAGRKE